MSYWAKLDENNKVTKVVRGNDYDPAGDEGYKTLVSTFGGTWVKTSYNASTNGFRKNYAGIGYSYDAELDAFIPPKPYDSWVLNESTCQWEAPVSCPDVEDKVYTWEESTLQWIEVTIE